MGLFDIMRQKAYQRNISEGERKKAVKQTIMGIASEGKAIDGLLVIYVTQGRIAVMEGGLSDDFEANVMIQRAQYLINRDGLVR